ncbi:CRIM1 protein, partial [Polypterus senegalus]|nr:CRIM1 protein [Polypterus senegalus]
MSCKQSCQNPVKIPGECCPFCEDDSCPDLTTYCSLQCPTGYEVDDYGCQVCECVSQIPKCRPISCETDEVLTTTPPLAPKISYCLTTSGHRYKEGESWHDGCRDCYCHAGHEMCVLITCLVPNCSHPVVRDEQCCPSCEDDSGSGQPEPPDLVVCRAPGGELYVEGETWQLDTCTRCTCRQGRVLCDTEVCPPVLCHSPFKAQTACCYACPDDQLKLLPINASQQEFCVSTNGEISLAGESWKENPCTSCICNKGTIRCFSQGCPQAFCRIPVLRKGQCCPQCLGKPLHFITVGAG